ncbi:hypothetical protein BDZ45DRAFT_811429 [Acephala macrosclerotiorum]|nr:hypothetical protein BDZ45DRAFT_811429 [Acephala macrosclerotiorum]
MEKDCVACAVACASVRKWRRWRLKYGITIQLSPESELGPDGGSEFVILQTQKATPQHHTFPARVALQRSQSPKAKPHGPSPGNIVETVLRGDFAGRRYAGTLSGGTAVRLKGLDDRGPSGPPGPTSSNQDARARQSSQDWGGVGPINEPIFGICAHGVQAACCLVASWS